MNFSTILKELRSEKNLSQDKLAQELGISQSAIAKWELGKTEPTAGALLLLSKYFGVTVDYLLGVEE
jgi:transcriptional regulator with XRE-family HTH domain